MRTGVSLFWLAQRADQRQAVHLRQHAVDDGDVIGALERQIVSGDAVIGLVGDVPGLAEGLGEIGGRVAVVFDDEDAHVGHIANPGRLRPKRNGGRSSGGLIRTCRHLVGVARAGICATADLDGRARYARAGDKPMNPSVHFMSASRVAAGRRVLRTRASAA